MHIHEAKVIPNAGVEYILAQELIDQEVETHVAAVPREGYPGQQDLPEVVMALAVLGELALEVAGQVDGVSDAGDI